MSSTKSQMANSICQDNATTLESNQQIGESASQQIGKSANQQIGKLVYW
jgi:hypothetical protein